MTFNSSYRTSLVLIATLLLLRGNAICAAEPTPTSVSASDTIAADKMLADKRRLAPLQPLVGEWKGVGQPRRGSNVGAWSEEMSWAWEFTKDRAQLAATLKGGKFYTALTIAPADKANRFQLTATLPDEKSTENFAGERDDEGAITFVRSAKKADAAAIADDRPARITIRTTAKGDRLIVLYERQANAGAGDGTEKKLQYARLAEVGSTRRGSQFATGATGPECVVTGGAGTIAVDYQGQTYYVCCSGCRDAFKDDPAGILAE